MGEAIVIPTVLILTLTLGTLTQLQDIAEDSAAKAVKYSDDMNNAIPCAFEARPLDECSPDLFSTDFESEMDRTQAILADLEAQQPGHLDKPKKH